MKYEVYVKLPEDADSQQIRDMLMPIKGRLISPWSFECQGYGIDVPAGCHVMTLCQLLEPLPSDEVRILSDSNRTIGIVVES